MSATFAPDTITEVICRLGKLPALDPDEDFYDAGFPSISALELLLEMEESYAVSLQDDDFIAARTARSLSDLISRARSRQNEV
jgi:acyl carrier protein